MAFATRHELTAMSPRYCWLAGNTCIEVAGTDATDFLNGQLSQAMDRIDAGSAPLAGWHDPRGRVRSIFRTIRLADRWRLVTARDGIEQTMKRLQTFVLRAKVTLALPSDAATIAVLDMSSAWLEKRALSAAAPRDAAAALDAVQIVHVGGSLWHGIGPRAALGALTADIEPADEATAVLAEIRLGVPAVTPATAERYVSQMLNLDVLGAVAFDKGCYPGQEVVARVRNLGAVKRRMRRFASDVASPPAIGGELLDPEGIAVGEVLRAAPAERGAEILAVVEHAAATRDLVTPDGSHWHLETLPYEVPNR
jgi:tRNA-modifying protein YgfZ